MNPSRMSYFPGPQGSVSFEKDVLLWSGAEERRVNWSRIRSVTSSVDGAIVLSDEEPLLIPKDVVWFEFVVEDIIAKAMASNANYEGPRPDPKARDLKIPADRNEQLNYTRRAQRFYRDRCPKYDEFKAFLKANLDWEFQEDSYHECALSICSGSPVDEGFSSDLDIPASGGWYRDFEKLVGGGRRSGRELLEFLKKTRP